MDSTQYPNRIEVISLGGRSIYLVEKRVMNKIDAFLAHNFYIHSI